MCNRRMDEQGQARVDRLMKWCIDHRIATSEDGKTIVPKAFAEKMLTLGLPGRDSYWMGILAKQDNRSFGPRKARAVARELRCAVRLQPNHRPLVLRSCSFVSLPPQ